VRRGGSPVTATPVKSSPFLVIRKISIIYPVDPLECLFSKRCCANLDFPFPYLKSWKFSWNLTERVCQSMQYTFCYNHDMLTPCHRATQKCMIAIPCVVEGLRISVLSYMTSCTRICQLVWLTYCFKVIVSLMQDAWV